MRKVAVFFKMDFFYFPKYERKNNVFYFLILLALIRPVGFIFHSPLIDGIGASTCISPLPTVFSKPGGIEAFTSNFLMVNSEPSSVSDTVVITSELFGKINGPHAYRNAISLMFGYFPLFPNETSDSIFTYLFYEDKILQNMGIPAGNSYTLINRNGKEEWKYQIVKDEK